MVVLVASFGTSTVIALDSDGPLNSTKTLTRAWVSSGRGFHLCRRTDREDSPELEAFVRWSVTQERCWRRKAMAGLA